MNDKKIIIFENKKIRRIWHKEDWYFSIGDVVRVLSESEDPKQYLKKMRQRESELQNNWGTICTPLEMIAQDGKRRLS